jgi:hypothetical protein
MISQAGAGNCFVVDQTQKQCPQLLYALPIMRLILISLTLTATGFGQPGTANGEWTSYAGDLRNLAG